MVQEQIIDVHSHLFNGGYALAELTAASWNLFKGTYPGRTREALAQRRQFGRLEGVHSFSAYVARLLDAEQSDYQGNYQTQRESLAKSAMAGNALKAVQPEYVTRLLDAAFSDCRSNYETQIQSLARSAMAGKELITVPLMLDIYYALDDNARGDDGSHEADRASPSSRSFDVDEDQAAAFEQHLEKVRSLVTKALARLPDKRERTLGDPGDPTEHLDKEIEKIRQIYLGAKERKAKGGYEGIELSPGFQVHMEALEDLARDHPGKVFPFLGVDPRRRGIQQLIEMKIAKGHGAFRGIKLYPPLGFLPTHPKLEAVYAYCAQYDIPITVHCGLGGFENLRQKNLVESWTGRSHWEDFSLRGSKSQYYAHPENWRPVLERWNSLRINFGHFGGSLANDFAVLNQPWVDTILDLMRDYPNVYADLSYIADPERRAKTLELIGQSALLKQRMMFGTDFILLAIDRDLGGLTQYFTNYAHLGDDLLYNNASRFLKLDE